MTAEEKGAFSEKWNEKLFEGGWICASWPKEYGGKGLSIMQNVVLSEEFAQVGAPMRGDFFGDTLVGRPSCSAPSWTSASSACRRSPSPRRSSPRLNGPAVAL